MKQVLRGNIIHAPEMGRLEILEHGCMVLEDGVIQGLYRTVPEGLEGAEVRDFGDRLLMQSFADMHLHAPQYPMLGMGMDLPLPAIRNQIASGVDIIVHLGRIRDKSRKVLEITEVVGCENGEIRLNPLYCFEELGESSEGNVVGKLQKKGGLLHEGKLKAAGLS